MKKLFLSAVFSLFSFAMFSQNVYTFFVNVVNEDWRFPLVGFVNTAIGDHTGAQVGFVNSNVGSFSGTQIGFLNTTTNDTRGGQIGFVNTVGDSFNGGQVGFVNTTSADIGGAQLGFMNIARRLEGLQLGFVNIVDEVVSGVPIGFLSVVRHGGYRAVELSVSEFHPVNVGFRIGVERFYTTISVAHNPFADTNSERFATGFGFGTIVPINDAFFFNPEVIGLASLGRTSRNLTSFVPFFGYHFCDRFSVTAAPTVTWSRSPRDTDLLEPVVSIATFEIDDRNEIVIGGRVSVRWRF